jgi:hypothetical protein
LTFLTELVLTVLVFLTSVPTVLICLTEAVLTVLTFLTEIVLTVLIFLTSVPTVLICLTEAVPTVLTCLTEAVLTVLICLTAGDHQFKRFQLYGQRGAVGDSVKRGRGGPEHRRRRH